MARQLISGIDFIHGKDKTIWLTQQGLARSHELATSLGGVWSSALWRKELIQKALSAVHVFHYDQHYIIVEGKVQIVDEFTGRVMPDRTWERGLHQMIEAKPVVVIDCQTRFMSTAKPVGKRLSNGQKLSLIQAVPC